MKVEKNFVIKKVLLTMLLLLVASGCTQFDIKLGIDSNNTAYLSYHLEVDVSGFDEHQQHNFRVALHEIAVHYRSELDFSVHLDIESSPLVLTAEKQVANENFEQAFDSLKSMLTNVDMSIFMEVHMDMTSYPRQTGYIIGAIADIPRIIKSQDAENLPHFFQANLEAATQESRGTITVSLPAGEAVNATHTTTIDNGQVIMAVPISFSEQTIFDMSAVVNIPTDSPDRSIGAIIEQQLNAILGDPNETAIEQQMRFRTIAQIATIAAAGLITLTLIITIIIVLVKKVRNS